MRELDISPDFTIEDIHKIREYNYERRKDMTFDEYRADVENGANAVLDQIEQLKRSGNATAASSVNL